ncbi:MAG: sulfotransferase [Salinibacter sp.]
MDSPIFIVGCPRSGTGIFHQVVRLHPDVAWVTPFSNWICGKSWFRRVPPRIAWGVESVLHRMPPTVLPSFFRGPYDGSLHLPGPLETHEGHSIWNRALSDTSNHLATEDDATEAVRTYLHDVIRWIRAYHQRPRFLSKTPRNAFRLRFLHALFPNAFFVHLIRDGRAVTASILKRRRQVHGDVHAWWGVKPPGWRSVQSASPIEQAAWTWRPCLSRVRDDATVLPNDRLLELQYESFTSEPERALSRFFSFVDLTPAVFFTKANRQHLQNVHPPRHTWRTRLTTTQQATLVDLLSPELERYGYQSAPDSS